MGGSEVPNCVLAGRMERYDCRCFEEVQVWEVFKRRKENLDRFLVLAWDPRG